jgi:hypothetical protein
MRSGSTPSLAPLTWATDPAHWAAATRSSDGDPQRTNGWISSSKSFNHEAAASW